VDAETFADPHPNTDSNAASISDSYTIAFTNVVAYP
jgi:hypothetical protein